MSAKADKAAAAKQSDRSWATYLGLLKPYRWQIALGALLGVIATVTGLWAPRIMENVIERLATGTSFRGDIILFAVLTFIGLVTLLAQWLMLSRAGEHAVYDVRRNITHRLLFGRVSDVLSRPTADLISRATSDAPLISLSVASGFISFVTAIAGIIGTLIFMGIIDPLLLGVTLGALVVLSVFMGLVMPIAGRERAKSQDAVGIMSNELDSSVGSLRTIKALRAEQSRSEAVLTAAQDARKHGVRSAIIEVLGYELGLGGMQIISVVVLGVGAYRVSQGYLSIAALVAFFMYTTNFTFPLLEVADGFSTIQTGLAASKRISEIEDIQLEEPDDDKTSLVMGDKTSPVIADSIRDLTTPILEFENVSAQYSPTGTEVVSGLNLAIPRTGHLAIVGPPGAGKTSAFSLAMRFINPTTGSIKLDGAPYEQLPYAAVRERFAYVDEDPTIVPGTIRDNLAIARPGISEKEMWTVLDAIHSGDAIRELPDGLDTKLVTATTSTGTLQRLAIARALLQQADITLFDEVTTQADYRTADAIHEAIAELAQQRAVITITDDEDLLQQADQVVLLENGHVRAIGTHQELAASDPLYREQIGLTKIDAVNSHTK